MTLAAPRSRQGRAFLALAFLAAMVAVVGGFLFNKLGAAGVTGLNLYSMFVAVVGSVIVLVLYHAVRRAA